MPLSRSALRASAAALALVAPIVGPLSSAGCGHMLTGELPHPDPEPRVQPKLASFTRRPSKPATARAPYTEGRAWILMYHHVGTNPNPVFRTEEGFLKDLTRLEKLGFRPVTIAEYLAGCPYLQAGASPVVFTFDDSNPDQLRLLPDGEVDPHCFMGLWLEFAKTHPDFPPKATFFVIPSSFFGQRPLWDKKLALLQSWGCQIANHTITHPDFRRISDARVEREIALCDAWLEAHGAGRDAPLALPYGEKPHNRELLRGFEYKGRDVHPVAVLNVGSNPARMPGQPGFDPLNLPRIQAGEHRYELDYWLDRAETGKTHSYVAPAPGP